ncbi:MAG: ring,2-phenylacetyl-CoA epoxidase subunit PaaD [Micromonosporaceae bacterium]
MSAQAVAASIVDPEIRELTIEELGILREVREDGSGGVVVSITPTYSGCPAMDVIRADILGALHRAGFSGAVVRTVLEPAWSTDMISEAGRAKLAAAGIAPPGPAGPVTLALPPACPRCGSRRTEQLSRFGATACKALWRCRVCREPFEGVKPL